MIIQFRINASTLGANFEYNGQGQMRRNNEQLNMRERRGAGEQVLETQDGRMGRWSSPALPPAGPTKLPDHYCIFSVIISVCKKADQSEIFLDY